MKCEAEELERATRRLSSFITLAIVAIFPVGSFSQTVPKENVINLLRSGRTLRGMHETLGGPQKDGIKWLRDSFDGSVNLWSGDFGFSDAKQNLVDDTKKRPLQQEKIIRIASAGTLITLSWHQCSPVVGEPCSFKDGVQLPLEQQEWKDLLNPASTLYSAWRDSLNPLVDLLKTLQQRDIPVLLRPYHESNIPGMWWHGTPEQSKKLWLQLQSVIREQGINNVLWVWSVSFHRKYWSNVADYFPTEGQVDVIGLDIYPPAKAVAPPFSEAYVALAKLAGGRPIALTEISKLPSRTEQNSGRWSYVVPWGMNMLQRDNSYDEIKEFYSSDR